MRLRPSIALMILPIVVMFIFTHTENADADIPPSTIRVSVASDGSEANYGSYMASISGDGRYVAFVSGASNLVASDTNSIQDVFVHDTHTGETIRVNVSNLGDQANGGSGDAQISGNGRYVVFSSYASNLVPDDSNFVADIFLYDIQLGVIERVNLTNSGFQAQPGGSVHPAISFDGRYVAFDSGSSNLDPPCSRGVFVRDRTLGQTTCVSVHSDGTPGNSEGGALPINFR